MAFLIINTYLYVLIIFSVLKPTLSGKNTAISTFLDFLFQRRCFDNVYVRVCGIWVCEHRCLWRALGALELGLGAVVSHLTWVPGTKLEFSGRAVSF